MSTCDLVARPRERFPQKRVVMKYDTCAEARENKEWYERTFQEPSRTLFVRKSTQ